jgi:Xaa-Pro dipeptidase
MARFKPNRSSRLTPHIMNSDSQCDRTTPVNISRAKMFMEEAGLDVLVATSPENVTYLTGYSCWLGPVFREYMVRPGGTHDLLPTFGIFTSDAKSVLVVDGLLGLNAGELELDDIYLTRTLPMENGNPAHLHASEMILAKKLAQGDFASSAAEGLAKALQGRGLSKGRIGLDSEFLASDVRVQIDEYLPDAEIRNCSNLFRLIRMVKSDEEIRRMRRALRIAEAAAEKAFTTARIGQPIDDITQTYLETVAANGALFEHMAYGPRGIGITTRAKTPLRADDYFYADFGTIFDDYLSDSGLTFAATPLPDALLEKYKILRDSIVETASMMRPGTKSSQVAEFIQKFCEERGIAMIFPHGHGVGLVPRDYPILVPDTGLHIQDECIEIPSDLPLEEGMVLNLETPLFMPPEASLHVEQTFLVTASGTEPLTSQDRELPISPS